MNRLKARFLENVIFDHSLDSVSSLLDKGERHLLNQAPWSKYSYKPGVQFAIAYSTDSIFLKYYVEEKTIRAVNTVANSPVYEDTCVEFFIVLDKTDGYYNFEFNCIGTALVGFGHARTNRRLLSKELISKIKYQSRITNSNNAGLVHWELTLAIPLFLFESKSGYNFRKLQCRGNFYKCGDLLPEPHYLAWSNIQTAEPNFHLPEFFGIIEFE